MDESDDDTHFCDPGFITPPLSPSKTVSTEGWLSPRTPMSPRKARSCVFSRDLGTTTDLPEPQESPTKSKPTTRFAALHLADIPSLSPYDATSLPQLDSPNIDHPIPFDGFGPYRHMPSICSDTRGRCDEGSA